MKTLKNGLLIAVEGIDGAGKSVLCTHLKDRLASSYEIVMTKEPGGTVLGKGLRETLLAKDVPVCEKAEFLLFATDRAQHFEQVVLPALKEGKVVISDRMADSSLVYQAYGRGLDAGIINTVNNWVMNNRQPDLVFYLKITPEEAYKRIHRRNMPLTSFEREITFMHKIANGFDALVAPRKNVVTLDALLSPDVIINTALEAIDTLVKTL